MGPLGRPWPFPDTGHPALFLPLLATAYSGSYSNGLNSNARAGLGDGVTGAPACLEIDYFRTSEDKAGILFLYMGYEVSE